MDAVPEHSEPSGQRVPDGGRPGVMVDMELLERALDRAGHDIGDDGSAEYRKGKEAALRFARICVLDEIAIAAAHFIDQVDGDGRADRDRARVLAALRTVTERLNHGLRNAASDYSGDEATGYRDGLRVALDLTAERERVVAAQAGEPARVG
ncbi:hypothetical protein MHAS_02325 [Mycolicibacterium hassiacum DSM 44199]|jgi:hypothetical protein|uniref:hypothetical protein n=1 Tax=Mycolicibacterium hassiacum TaxID=46351 RepID=UPI00031D3984|nr:hypothetical protein [Mycolicibacterium hassiacum]MBX5488918.1 hypothetical protein [Mycolicibacterium hassiacum]MDA4085105.1 hypothetical protein [Mycolicibacterium hassiacum DSM 44199]VCT90616.1 hypothetical protein MHAS_02325 [Mycolicibacterium hassiacum DSM 44199]